MQIARALPWALALSLAAGAASADAGTKTATPAASAPTTPAPGASKGDAGTKDESESLSLRERRNSYVSTTRKKIREAVRANGKATTQEERIVIGMHWRHTMRLFRVRHFAEKANDMATVGRCDGLLSKADTKFFAKLAELNAKAPAKEAKDAKAGDGGAPSKGEHKGDGKGRGEGKGDKDKAEKKGDKQ